jgi:hypothetical protein
VLELFQFWAKHPTTNDLVYAYLMGPAEEQQREVAGKEVFERLRAKALARAKEKEAKGA